MTARHLVLITAAVATLGLGVYLAIAVRSTTPAIAARDDHEVQGQPTAPSESPSDAAAREENRSTRTLPPRRDTTPEPPPPRERPPALGSDAPIHLAKDEMMASANKAYDRQNFDEAIDLARRVLSSDPSNVRMLRIVVSSSCILDDAADAQRSYLLLPPSDRAQMRARCERYGVTFTES